MARKLVEDLELGMALGADLYDQRGRFLLPAGTVLTDQHLRLLQQWRVPVVHVDSPEEDAEDWRTVSLGGLDPEVHIRHERELAELFSLCDRTSPFASRLYYFLLDRLDRKSRLDGGRG